LLVQYPDLLIQRYKLKEKPASAAEALASIGRKRGCLRPGGVIDLHKAAELVLHELRSGKLGRISLETPDMIAAELAEIEARQLEEQARLEEQRRLLEQRHRRPREPGSDASENP
jgi:ribosome biogenesis GTPase A